MAVQDTVVRVVEDRRLDAPAEQRLRLAHEVLVERVFARDEDGEPVPAPAGAPPLLAQARDRAGEADRDRAVQEADVDPELERIGRRHAEQLTLDEPALDLTSLLRRVSGAIRSKPGCLLRISEPLDREAVDELGRAPRLGEADRAQAARYEIGHQSRGLAESACAQAELLVLERRVPEGDRSLGPRSGVARDHGHVHSEQGLRELVRVRDRGRREQELRLGPVDRGRPAQPAEDVRHVRAEHPAVDVRLVHDHVAEVLEDVPPAVVVREDSHMEHVRVGEDDVRPLADLPAPLGLGVPVVDRGTQSA